MGETHPGVSRLRGSHSVALSERQNYLRNASFQGPEWVPCGVSISGASWLQWREEMEEVVARHPILFPRFRKGQRDFDSMDPGPAHRRGQRFTDAWGCVWRSEIDGLEGQVVRSPLADWEAFDSYVPPDPLVTGDRGPADWDGARKRVARAKKGGRLTWGSVPHGFLFMRLYYLRGFDNFMMDVAQDDPRLDRLCRMLLDHNLTIVNQWLEMGVDAISFGDDLGTQTASMLGPKHFRRWIQPGYEALFGPCRQAGVHVMLHSDGYIMDIMDDILASGVSIINPQDLCNGIDPLAREVKGRACIRLDVDRQTIVPFGTPAEIRGLIEEEVRKLGSPEGGLELICGIYPPTAPVNVDAVCSAMEEFRTYWWDGRG